MRLPNSFGSVYKLAGHRRRPWCARKTTGWKDNGQPIYAFIGYYATRTEALTALSDYTFTRGRKMEWDKTLWESGQVYPRVPYEIAEYYFEDEPLCSDESGEIIAVLFA